MLRRLAIPLFVALMLSATTASAATPATYAPPASRDAARPGQDVDTSSAIVVLKQQPAATYDGHIQGYEKTKTSNGKLNPNSAAVKKYVGYLKTEHSAFAAWLRKNVPSAKITSEIYTVLNAVAVKLNGNAIGKLAQSADVLYVEYNALYQPAMTQSVDIINARDAWAAAGGQSKGGEGVKVGVVDSGIDYRHPFFDPAKFSYPAGFPKCDAIDSTAGKPDQGCKYVSPKVIVAKTFYNNQNQTGFDALPIPGVGDHGTHVAGTVAGVMTPAPAPVTGTMSGVAPGAWLANYNVFPGTLDNARSEDILNAVDAAVNDGMDVITLSLGGPYHGNNDLLAKGLDNVVVAGIPVSLSAGNEGPGPSTISSPGRARNVTAAGASTNRHFVGQPITANGQTVGAAKGDFAALPGGTFDAIDGASTACNGQSLPAAPANTLMFVNRGTCAFSEKVANAKKAGATGVIVINNVAGDPTAMARSLGYDDTIPAVMVGKSEGAAIRTATSVTVVAEFSEIITTANQDILAGFSSQGPTRVDFAIKPDVTSVGVNVLSSIPCTVAGDCADAWAFYSGTSMASPHLAGSAAVLLSIHPSWTPWQIKSALVNTADLVVRDAVDGSLLVGPMAQGAGRENLTSAAGATVTFNPVSASFGKIGASNNVATPLTIKLTNTAGIARTLAVSSNRFSPAAGSLGSVYAAGTKGGADSRIAIPTSVTVPANGSATLTVVVKAGLPNGTVVQGWITVGSYHFAYWAMVAP